MIYILSTEKLIKDNFDENANPTRIVTSDFVNTLVGFAIREGYPVWYKEGKFQNSYLITGAKTLEIGNIKPREYIILKESIHDWYSEMTMTMTDAVETIERKWKRCCFT